MQQRVSSMQSPRRASRERRCNAPRCNFGIRAAPNVRADPAACSFICEACSKKETAPLFVACTIRNTRQRGRSISTARNWNPYRASCATAAPKLWSMHTWGARSLRGLLETGGMAQWAAMGCVELLLCFFCGDKFSTSKRERHLASIEFGAAPAARMADKHEPTTSQGAATRERPRVRPKTGNRYPNSSIKPDFGADRPRAALLKAKSGSGDFPTLDPIVTSREKLFTHEFWSINVR